METINGYDDWKLSNGESDEDVTPAHKCSWCDEWIYEGDRYFNIGGEVYCKKCAFDLFSDLA